jgi:cytochrome c
MILRLLTAAVAALLLSACSEKPAATAEAPAAAEPAAPAAPAATPMPTPDITISTTAADVTRGEETFAMKGCTACHKVGGGKLVGPDLKDVLTRRDQEWVERMILHPDVMLKEDPVARKLLAEHYTPMPNQNVDPKEELPFILSYLKGAE